MKKIKTYISIVFFNLIFLYLGLLFVDKVFLETNYLTKEHLIINAKTYAKTHSIINKRVPAKYLSNADGLLQKTYSLQTGKLGDIKIDDYQENDYDHIDLLFMGGSTTECRYVDEKNRFPFLVHKKFNEKLTTVNLSKGGKNSYHSLLQLITQLNDVEIKNLVLLHNINDLAQLMYYDSYTKGVLSRKGVLTYEEIKSKKKKPFLIPYNILKLSQETLIEVVHSISPRLYDELKDVGFLKSMRINEFGGDRTKANIDEGDFLKFKNNLKYIVDVCKTRRINLILMTQFNRLNLDDKYSFRRWGKGYNANNALDYKDFVGAYAKFNDIIRDVSKENNLQLIDLDSLVPKNNKHMYDWVHLNDKGSILVSDIIFNEIKLK